MFYDDDDDDDLNNHTINKNKHTNNNNQNNKDNDTIISKEVSLQETFILGIALCFTNLAGNIMK